MLHSRPSGYRGRRECRVHAAPIALRANEKDARRPNTGTPKSLRHSLRNGFTAYSVLSPVNRAFLPLSPADLCASAVRPSSHLGELDPSVGGTGPHGLTVRAAPHALRHHASIAARTNESWRSRNAPHIGRDTRDVAHVSVKR